MVETKYVIIEAISYFFLNMAFINKVIGYSLL